LKKHTTNLAISSSIVAIYFSIFGIPYPGESIEDVQLTILIAASLILCGGLYYYLKDVIPKEEKRER
jgi:hypothetical protein